MKENIKKIYKLKADYYLYLLSTFDEFRINYIILNLLVSDDNPGDLDILIFNTKYAEVKKALFKCKFHYYTKYTTDQFLWNKYIKKVGFVQAHIYMSFSFYGKNYLKGISLLPNLTKNSSFNFYVFLIESYFKGKFRLKQFEVYKTIIDEFNYIDFCKNLPYKDVELSRKVIFEYIKALNEGIQKHKLYKSLPILRQLNNKLWRGTRRIIRIFTKKDRYILFLGVDGSGKSTLIREVSSDFARGGILPQCIYLGLRESKLNNSNQNTKEKKLTKSTYDNTNVERNSGAIHLNYLRLMKLLLYWIEYNVKYFIKIILNTQGADSIFLIDRCYIDLLFYYPNSIVEFLFLHISFLPSKIIFLTGEKIILYNRKKEMPKMKFDHLYEFYRILFLKMKKYKRRKVLLVDTTKLDNVQSRIEIGDFIMEC